WRFLVISFQLSVISFSRECSVVSCPLSAGGFDAVLKLRLTTDNCQLMTDDCHWMHVYFRPALQEVRCEENRARGNDADERHRVHAAVGSRDPVRISAQFLQAAAGHQLW